MIEGLPILFGLLAGANCTRVRSARFFLIPALCGMGVTILSGELTQGWPALFIDASLAVCGAFAGHALCRQRDTACSRAATRQGA